MAIRGGGRTITKLQNRDFLKKNHELCHTLERHSNAQKLQILTGNTFILSVRRLLFAFGFVRNPNWLVAPSQIRRLLYAILNTFRPFWVKYTSNPWAAVRCHSKWVCSTHLRCIKNDFWVYGIVYFQLKQIRKHPIGQVIRGRTRQPAHFIISDISKSWKI